MQYCTTIVQVYQKLVEIIEKGVMFIDWVLNKCGWKLEIQKGAKGREERLCGLAVAVDCGGPLPGSVGIAD